MDVDAIEECGWTFFFLRIPPGLYMEIPACVYGFGLDLGLVLLTAKNSGWREGEVHIVP